MPNVKKGESKKDYVERCMAYTESQMRFPDKSQRYAVCNSKYDQSKNK